MFFHRKQKETAPQAPAPQPTEEKKDSVREKPEAPSPTPSNINITLNNSNNASPAEVPPVKRNVSVILVKAISAVIVLAVFGTAVYSVAILLRDQTKATQDGYITLQGKSYSQSVRKYGEFGTTDATKSRRSKLKDVAVLGNRLFLSESKITPSLYDGKHNDKIVSGDGYIGFALYNLNQDSTGDVTSFSEGYAIDVSYLSVGDYLVFPIQKDIPVSNHDRYPYSLSSEKSLDESFYSLPDRAGNRKRVTLKNNKLSPYFVIRVEDCGSVLPDDYYDAVIYRSFYQEIETRFVPLPQIDDNSQAAYHSLAEQVTAEKTYKIKAVTSLKEADKTKATLAVGFSDSITENLASVYTVSYYPSFHAKALSQSELKGYDGYPEIRELSGYLDKSGEGYADVDGNNILAVDDDHIGKESFLLKTSASTNNEDSLKDLLKQVNANMKA